MNINPDRKLYSVRETYWIFYNGIRTMKYMARARKNDSITLPFMERMMLAVTEVNRCSICSYAHTKVALEAGMSNEEVMHMLSGDLHEVPEEEQTAVLFAQHYAYTRGKPSQKTWERVQEEYGVAVARGILGATRAIMIGNAYGIPWSSFVNRFRGNADLRSSLLYELSMITFGTLLIPVALVHAAVAPLFKMPLI